MENTKSRLVYSGTVNMTEKRDNKGNPTGLAGSCTMPLILADGQQHLCVVIPIDQNPAFFVSPKTGAVTLDINVYENGAPNRAGNTHFIRASVGSKGKQMSDEARRQASPIIGNLKPFDASQKAQQGGQNLGGGYNPYQQAPQGGYAPQQGYNPQGAPQGYAPQGAPQQGYNPYQQAPQGAPQQGYSPAPQNARQQGFQQAPQGGYPQGAPQQGGYAPEPYNGPDMPNFQ